MKSLSQAIFGKCISGTDLYADIGGRLYKGRPRENTEYPYIVYKVVTNVPSWTFTSTKEDILIQFSLFSAESSSTEAENMFAHLKALYDDCILTVPGSTVIWFRRGNAVLMPEEHTTKTGTINDVWHYAIEYELHIQLGTGEGEALFIDTDSGSFDDFEEGQYIDR